MKFSKAFKYQLQDLKTSVMIFYCVMIAVVFILFPLIAINFSNENGTNIGLETSTPVFLFIASLCIFSTNFSFMNQNSISRRTMVLSCFAMFAALAGIMLAIDILYTTVMFILSQLFDTEYATLYDTIFHFGAKQPDSDYINTLMYLPSVSAKIARIAANVIFNYILYIAAAITGYFISIVFYRLSNMWRVILFIILPITVLNSAWTIYKAGKSFFDTIARWFDRNVLNNSTGFIIAMLIWTFVFATLSYIIATRARLKPQKA